MLKYKMYKINIVCICLLAGCGNSNIDNLTIEQNDSEIQDSIAYDEYSGYWSYEGKSGNRFWQREELNYHVRLQEIINFRERFLHSRK